jgi:hypothetical protein
MSDPAVGLKDAWAGSNVGGAAGRGRLRVAKPALGR